MDKDQSTVVHKVDSAIHQINLYPVDSAIIGFHNTYHWIEIYPKDSTIQHLNNQCQMVAQHTARCLVELVGGPTGLHVYLCLHLSFTLNSPTLIGCPFPNLGYGLVFYPQNWSPLHPFLMCHTLYILRFSYLL